MRPDWTPSLLGSAAHAGWAIQTGQPLAQETIVEAVGAVAEQIDAQRDSSIPREVFWTLLVEACLPSEDPHMAATRFEGKLTEIRRGLPGAPHAVKFAPHLQLLNEALRKAVPRLESEMPLRSRPLAEQWDARGPGMCHQLRQLTGYPFPGSPKVYLLYPTMGGGGGEHRRLGGVRFEALLVNPHATYPEVARLAWLLTCLQAAFETPQIPVQVTRQGACIFALRAAAEVDLTTFDLESVRNALDIWHLCSSSHAETLKTAERLWGWWQSVEAEQDATTQQHLARLAELTRSR